jgi:CHAT domain-containing protein
MHFQPLQGTREEVAAIENVYQHEIGKEGMVSLQEAQATKAAVLAEACKHRYLHLATHGFFIEEKLPVPVTLAQRGAERFGDMLQKPQAAAMNPGLLSGLALAGANRAGQADVGGTADNQGVVTAEEISSQNLDGVELVMLSACETGLGKSSAGEGLLGLQRAFQAAGARSVVASLWSVPDNETRLLMEEFYTNLWHNHLSPLESLRQAQLAMLRGTVKAGQERGLHRLDVLPKTSTGKLSPYYWAAFVLSGDWR